MLLHPAPPISAIDPHQPAQVRALADEMAARLEAARTLPANLYLGQRPDIAAHPLGFYCQLAFPIVAAAAMVTAIFTLGPVLWALTGATFILLLLSLFLGADKRRQYDQLRRQGVWAPAVWIAVEEQAFDWDREQLPVGHFLFTHDPQLATDLPRLVELGRLIRSGQVDQREDVGEMNRRIGERDLHPPPLAVSKALCGNDRTWFHSIEFAPVFLPEEEPTQALFFVLAMPEPSQAWHVELLQSLCLWGDGGEEVVSSFPLQKLEVAR